MDDVQKSRLLHLLLLMLIAWTTSNTVYANPVYISKELQESAAKYSDYSPSLDMQERAGKIAAQINSRDWQQKQAEMKKRIRASLSMPEPDSEEAADLVTQDRPVLFVSSSMPIRTLRAYAADLAKTNGVMIIRGGIQGLRKISLTLKFTSEILKIDASCQGARCPMLPTPVLIDPVLFKKYKISTVPALVFQKDMNIASYCERPEELQVGSEPHIVYGDSALEGMLRELLRLSKDNSIRPFLAKLN
ncbi:type-F conjugative transfer system pilin assembly protein TrbC [Endozoicomonas sp. ONNA1]|uniref:type-F conjugative transfer system pilin assembly protein TrbC n=1 Tax=Endozoicomonas sp. ONNA1 TaxID=2828740 RepID=UPI002148E6DA|nr:type-F conjugative transfer system pilin assembly protein TrbC [Endozoicomonas sp. ONNA1]